jgi:hypothetical protein
MEMDSLTKDDPIDFSGNLSCGGSAPSKNASKLWNDEHRKSESG